MVLYQNPAFFTISIFRFCTISIFRFHAHNNIIINLLFREGAGRMKAVIMAGGEGRRLRPVTGSEMPKPLVPFLGRPLMEHIIMLLKRCGFDDICVTVAYRAEDIIRFFGDGSRLGVKICYREETSPLGTAGGVKNCADFYGNEDFLVISGDAACDFDLSAFAARHAGSGAAASIALHRSSSPLNYGLAVTDAAGNIRSFIEKPDWRRVVTDLVNTGIYILSPRAMQLVPDGEKYDFGKQLFPELLRRGEKILGVQMDGYWCDVGSPLSYYRCCADALEGRLKVKPGAEFSAVSAPAEHDEAESCDECLEYPCSDRAALMGALSAALMDMGADFEDGLRLSGRHFDLHISPLSSAAALRIAVNADDAEYARSLALSVRELAQSLDAPHEHK